MKTIRATAPMRIDLAGGTLDIFPLYVFEENCVTVNAAVSLLSTVGITARDDESVTLIADDLGVEQSAPDWKSLETGGPLDLLARIVRFYKPKTGFELHTRNNVPKGSGLGASSSLLIALSHALQALNGTDFTNEQIINQGADIEAASIRVPTGKQDYYSATHGAVNAIWFGMEGNRVEPLAASDEMLQALESRLVLSFAGAPRFSGATNWHMLRSYIDGNQNTIDNIRRIRETAHAVRESILRGDFDSFAKLLAVEWENRRTLADGVSTPELERMMAAAVGAGARASKVCGAGGGGCMITFADPDRRDAVRQALADAGAQLLDYSISPQGVQVSVS